eukprot:750173-Hanusia_phi.AAC.5
MIGSIITLGKHLYVFSMTYSMIIPCMLRLLCFKAKLACGLESLRRYVRCRVGRKVAALAALHCFYGSSLRKRTLRPGCGRVSAAGPDRTPGCIIPYYSDGTVQYPVPAPPGH